MSVRSRVVSATERLERLGPDWPHRSRSRIVRAGGMDWHVQSFRDDGPYVLLLHGTGASTHSWRDVAPMLGDDARVLAVDLPGHGASDMPTGDGMTLPGMARRLAALCEAEGFAPDLVAGHSAGAAVAIAAAITTDLAPAAIVGFNAALQPMQGYALFSPLAKGLFLNPLTPSLFARFGSRERAVRNVLNSTCTSLDDRGIDLYGRLFSDSAHVRGALGMMAGWDLDWLQRRLPELTGALTLVTTANDGTVPARDAPSHVARVRDGRLIELRDGGHLVHEARPAEAVTIILDTLARAGLRARTEANIG